MRHGPEGVPQLRPRRQRRAGAAHQTRPGSRRPRALDRHRRNQDRRRLAPHHPGRSRRHRRHPRLPVTPRGARGRRVPRRDRAGARHGARQPRHHPGGAGTRGAAAGVGQPHPVARHVRLGDPGRRLVPGQAARHPEPARRSGDASFPRRDRGPRIPPASDHPGRRHPAADRRLRRARMGGRGGGGLAHIPAAASDIPAHRRAGRRQERVLRLAGPLPARQRRRHQPVQVERRGPLRPAPRAAHARLPARHPPARLPPPAARPVPPARSERGGTGPQGRRGDVPLAAGRAAAPDRRRPAPRPLRAADRRAGRDAAQRRQRTRRPAGGAGAEAAGLAGAAADQPSRLPDRRQPVADRAVPPRRRAARRRTPTTCATTPAGGSPRRRAPRRRRTR